MASNLARQIPRLCRKAVCPVSRRFTTTSRSSNDAYDKEKRTHFGFQNVSEEQKAQKVHGVFQNVADNYDLMNDVMSGGVHRAWKDHFISRLGPKPHTHLLDVGGGTGDIAFRFIEKLIKDGKGRGRQTTVATEEVEEEQPLYKVTICDISQNMLDVGMKRAEKLGYSEINWICGDAEKLPFPDDSFDCYTIAFGIRNVVHIEKVISEAYRVLKPGGRFLCLEFSQVTNPVVKWIYDKYSFQVIPPMGKVVAGDWQSYQYLVESIRQFPDQSGQDENDIIIMAHTSLSAIERIEKRMPEETKHTDTPQLEP